MSYKKRTRRAKIMALVLEWGAISVGVVTSASGRLIPQNPIRKRQVGSWPHSPAVLSMGARDRGAKMPFCEILSSVALRRAEMSGS